MKQLSLNFALNELDDEFTMKVANLLPKLTKMDSFEYILKWGKNIITDKGLIPLVDSLCEVNSL